MSPRDTFDQYVFPSMKDFEANPSKHRAVSALSYIDALAEDVWNAVGKGARRARATAPTRSSSTSSDAIGRAQGGTGNRQASQERDDRCGWQDHARLRQRVGGGWYE